MTRKLNLPESLQKDVSAANVVMTSDLQNVKIIDGCCFKLSVVWQFVKAAIGKEYILTPRLSGISQPYLTGAYKVLVFRSPSLHFIDFS